MRSNAPKGLQIGWALAAQRRKPESWRICPICGVRFQRRGNRIIKTLCCSLKCKAKAQVGRIVPGFNLKPKTGPIQTCPVCGKIFQNPPSRKAKYCSHACRFKDAKSLDAIRGKNHYNWKGGITPKEVLLRKSIQARQWTLSVFRRDNFACRACGQRRDLQAHHIFHWSECPSLRYDIENGITLCRFHHKLIHWCGRHFGSKYTKLLQEDYEY